MKRISAVENPQSEPRLSQDPGLETEPPGTEFWDDERLDGPPPFKAPKHVAIFFMLTPIVCHEISDAPFAIRIDNNADLALALGSDGLHKRLACP